MLGIGLSLCLRKSVASYPPPALSLDFKSGTLDPRITFTRNSTATRVGTNGLLETVSQNIPRFDYDPITLSCIGLLIEEQRTNLLSYSGTASITHKLTVSTGLGTFIDGETVTSTGGGSGVYVLDVSTATIYGISNGVGTFSGTLTGTTSGATKLISSSATVWSKVGSVLTRSATTAPDGTLTATKVTEDTSTGSHNSQQLFQASANTTYCMSIFVKAGECSAVRLVGRGGNWVVFPEAYFDLSSGNIISTTTSATIFPVGNGWFRCAVMGTNSSTAGTNSGLTVNLLQSSTNLVSYTGDGVRSIYVWGAQMEVGGFQTSYIPTTSSQVTRSPDIATITGTNFSSWYKQEEGTFVCYAQGSYTAGTLASVNDGSTNESVTLAIGSVSGGSISMSITDGGVLQAQPYQTVVATSKHKVTAAYKINDVALSVDGSVPSTDSSATIPTANRLDIGCSISASQLNGRIQSLAYYSTRLPNAALQVIA